MINPCTFEIVKTEIFYTTIEDLNVSGIMKNRHLFKAVDFQKFYEFVKRKNKSDKNGIKITIIKNGIHQVMLSV